MEQPQESVSQLESLPVEVIAAIAEFLAVRDICNCCATSSVMRELFNDNAIWRPRYDPDRVEYLKNAPAKVEPKFNLLETSESVLSPLPQCRISFMYENHLWNNWRQGKFKKEKIINKDSSDSNYAASFHLFQSNDCVLAQLKDKTEFLNVREIPASDAVEKLLFGNQFYESTIYCCNDTFVTALKSSVHVFQIDFVSKQSKLTAAFFFEDSQKLELNGLGELKSMLVNRRGKDKGECTVAWPYFVGTLLGDSVMHIWNLKTGEKLAKALCPIKQSKILTIHASNTMKCILKVVQDKNRKSTFLAYDLKKLEYLPFNNTTEASSYCVYNDLLVILSNDQVQVINYQTSQLHIPTMFAKPPLKMLKNNILFVVDGKLHKLNLVSKKLDIFPLHGITNFELLSTKFVQVYNNWLGEVWEFDSSCANLRKTSMNFWFHVCGFFLNKACTRYIVREGAGYLLNFW